MAVAAKAKKKSMTAKEFRRRAAAWASMWHSVRAHREELKEMGDRVIRLMKRFGKTWVATSFGDVVIISDVRKEASLKDIAKYFGKRRAEEFWKKLKPRRSEYLSVCKDPD